MNIASLCLYLPRVCVCLSRIFVNNTLIKACFLSNSARLSLSVFQLCVYENIYLTVKQPVFSWILRCDLQARDLSLHD